MKDYYDAILFSIPVTFAALLGALLAVGTTLTAAVPAAAVPAVLLIGHAMFVRAPTDAATPEPRGSEPEPAVD